MKSKQYLFFLLTGSLLLLPVTSYYAISWKDVKALQWKDLQKKASAFMTEDTMKIMPGVAIVLGLAAGGLYYYLTSKKVENPIRSLVTLDYVWPTLEQFKVYCQFNFDGGGAASCGYQTLLRGMQVVRAKSEHESDQDLQKTLNDQNSIAIYFGKDGEWRKEIITRRKDEELRKVLHAKFLSALNKNCDDKVKVLYGSQAYEPIIADLASKKLTSDKARELYISALGFLEEIVLSISKNPKERTYQYDFTDEALQNYLVKSLEQLKNRINGDLIEILQKPEIINQCFDLERMRKEFFSKDLLFNLSVLVDDLNKDPNLREDFAGEWLTDGELEYLWKQNRIDIVPDNVDCGFKAIANFDFVGNPNFSKEFDEVGLYIDENIKPFLNKKKQLFAMFALGTMRQDSDTEGTRGHWYPLVMYQNEEGKRQYYIMDSASYGKTNRLKDTNAWKIINLIEQ